MKSVIFKIIQGDYVIIKDVNDPNYFGQLFRIRYEVGQGDIVVHDVTTEGVDITDIIEWIGGYDRIIRIARKHYTVTVLHPNLMKIINSEQ